MSLMDNAEIRRENLRALKKKYGTAELLRRLGIIKQHLSQYIGKNPNRNISRPTAKKIEEAFNLPDGWMDYPHYESAEYLQKILDLARSLPVDQQKLLLQFVQTMYNVAGAPRNKNDTHRPERDKEE